MPRRRRSKPAPDGRTDLDAPEAEDARSSTDADGVGPPPGEAAPDDAESDGAPPPAVTSSDADPVKTGLPEQPRATADRPFVRFGVYAWSLIGLLIVLVAAGFVLSRLSLVVVPLALALFPAALLAPVSGLMIRNRIPPAIASLLAILGALGVIGGVFTLLVPIIAAEMPGLIESLQEGYDELRSFIEQGPFGLPAGNVDDLLEQGREALEGADLASGAMGAVSAVAEGVAGILFTFVFLFFYLKDGPRIAGWFRDLFPNETRVHVHELGVRGWRTIGAYFRGQLVVALVDAIGIGVGLALLGIPLALPLAVLVFFGGLFPIVGAVITGVVAVLVALATEGPAIALAVVALIVAVQQLESNVLAPVVLGRATQLHPMAVLVALTVGGILLGVLGAFVAVPIAAGIARAVDYLRNRPEPGEQPAPQPA